MNHPPRIRVLMACLLSATIYRVLVVSSLCMGAEVLLPRPVDVPHGPEGVAGPGGAALPPLTDATPADAPAISAISDVTFPDETLVMAGARLTNARLLVWREGGVEDLAPLRAAEDRLQAVVPGDWPVSTMLVWPVRDGLAGAPIRVNGATAWWAWPPRVTQGDDALSSNVLVMGRNLKLAGAEPQVYLRGPGGVQQLTVVAARAYQLTVELPRALPPGGYGLFAHNGTGGPFGWSEPVRVEIVARPAVSSKPLDVAAFGAVPDDGDDDAPAIQRAVDAAAEAGGGTIQFTPGIYHLGKTVTLPDVPGSGIHLLGAGMGDYDPASQVVTGRGTTLRYLPAGPIPDCLVHVACRWSSLRDLTLIVGHEGIVRAIHDREAPSRVAARIAGHDVTIRHARMVLLDLRPDVPQEQRKDLQIFDAALHLLAPGKANLLVCDCEFHSAGSGIEIGSLQRGHTEAGIPDPSTDDVCIERCVFRGYSPGFYKEPVQPASYQHMGIFNEGIQIPNGKRVIIRECDFAGADRRGGKMMNRSISVYNTSARDLFIAGNRSHDVGMICRRDDRLVNQGEQILFHFRYPHGGYFDVCEAGPDHVAVNPADPRNTGTMPGPHTAFDRAASRVLDEVGGNDHWIVFVSAGKGAGQYRVVVGAERLPDRVVLGLDRPWRVVPDHASRITLTTAFRRNIILGNTIDAGFIDPRSKVAGILFWYNAFENVIAENTLGNVGYGVGLTSGFRNPTGWNLVRDNEMEQMGGLAVECAEPAFYFDSCGAAGGPAGPLFQSGSDVAGWYAVGNVARSNRGKGSSVGTFLHARLGDAAAGQLPEQDAAGVIMPVLENSQFSDVERGVVLNRAAVWPLLRGND